MMLNQRGAAGGVAHGALTGLSNDDHTQYALLAGRSGGQTVIGGTASGNNLTLKSTSHATKGKVIFGNAGTSAYNESTDYLGIGTASPSFQVEVANAAGQSVIAGLGYANSAFFLGRRANGSVGSPSQVLADQAIAALGARGYHSGGAFTTTSSPLVQFHAAEDHTSIAQGTYISIATTPTGSTTRAEDVRIASKLVTLQDAVNLAAGTTTGSKFGTSTAQKIGFHNATPTIQRVGAAQAEVATTAATNSSPYGYSTAAQANAIVTLVNELRAALVEKGLIKGSA